MSPYVHRGSLKLPEGAAPCLYSPRPYLWFSASLRWRRLDGPCLGTGEWSPKHSFEGYGAESHAQLWPPGSVRCELDTPAGRIERVFPGTATYLVATLLALLPFGLWQLARG